MSRVTYDVMWKCLCGDFLLTVLYRAELGLPDTASKWLVAPPGE